MSHIRFVFHMAKIMSYALSYIQTVKRMQTADLDPEIYRQTKLPFNLIKSMGLQPVSQTL